MPKIEKKMGTGAEGGRTVGRVLKALELVALDNRPLRVVDVSKALDVPMSSAHALLQQLVHYDYFNIVGADRRYVQGPALALLSGRIRSGTHLIRVALPVIEKLGTDLGENIYLGVRQAKGIAYADSVEATFGVMAKFPLGVLRPLYCTSPGKIFLAYGVPPDQIDAMLGTEPLSAFTSHTVTDRAQLRRELDEVRKNGYALNEQGVLDDSYGISAPVFNMEARLIGCVTAGMPGVRYKSRKKLTIEHVIAAAAEISRGMGLTV